VELVLPTAAYAGGPTTTESAAGESAARAAATAAGATQYLILKTGSSGAFSETVSRLMETASGRELSRDVIWRAGSEGLETVFVNGLRVR
jgi:hypothetical protein